MALTNPSSLHTLSKQGLPVVQASGEAEATCAALNAAGLVDGCQTKDSDAFVFGAQAVYRSLHLLVRFSSVCLVSAHSAQGRTTIIGTVCDCDNGSKTALVRGWRGHAQQVAEGTCRTLIDAL